MEHLVDVLAKHLGDGWLLVAAAVIYLIVNSGIIPKLLGERRDAQAHEREAAAKERQSLVDNYEAEANNQRRWRGEDAARDGAHIKALEESRNRQEEVIAKLAIAVESSERGNARLRHLVANLFQHIAAQRTAERRRGVTPLPYDGWRDALNISPDLDERLRALFEDVSDTGGSTG